MAQSKKVLIIEDEEILAKNLRNHFHRCGWDGRIAGTGELAIEIASQYRPDLILFDYHLPDMNGFQALEAIRASHYCSGVLMTARSEDETVLADARQYGIVRILSKPFPLAGLQDLDLGDCTQTPNNLAIPPTQMKRPCHAQPGLNGATTPAGISDRTRSLLADRWMSSLPLLGAVLIAALIVTGGAFASQGNYDRREGWREATVVKFANTAALGGRYWSDCRNSAETGRAASSRFVVVSYKHMGRTWRRVVPLREGEAYRPGDRVYVNVNSCGTPLAKKSP